MEGHCSTGQSPQWAVVPMEEDEEKVEGIYGVLPRPCANSSPRKSQSIRPQECLDHSVVYKSSSLQMKVLPNDLLYYNILENNDHA